MRWMPVAALFAFAFLAMPASAQVHRCKDISGKLTYSDQPCAAGQSGGIIEPQKSREQILEERLQAAEANERKYRAQAVRQDAQIFEQQQRQPTLPYGSQTTAQDKASSRECKEAMKKLEFVSSIRTVPQDEKRMRTNAAITAVNAACGSNTPLMQEPSKVFVESSRSDHPQSFINQRGRPCSAFGGIVRCD